MCRLPDCARRRACTANPRVGGSIPLLATKKFNFLAVDGAKIPAIGLRERRQAYSTIILPSIRVRFAPVGRRDWFVRPTLAANPSRHETRARRSYTESQRFHTWQGLLEESIEPNLSPRGEQLRRENVSCEGFSACAPSPDTATVIRIYLARSGFDDNGQKPARQLDELFRPVGHVGVEKQESPWVKR